MKVRKAAHAEVGESVVVSPVVLRAVPCDAHEEYATECPLCLTGEQAALVNHPDLKREQLDDVPVRTFRSRVDRLKLAGRVTSERS